MLQPEQAQPQMMLMMQGRYVPVEGGQTPLRATVGSTGFDCFARVEGEDLRILPGEWLAVPLGFRLEILKRVVVPIDCTLVHAFDLDHSTLYQFELRSRSGLAFWNGITVHNAPGTIDADYTHEVRAILINHGSVPFPIRDGDRVCQAVWPHWLPWTPLPAGLRCAGADRAGGFGSTGAR